MSPVGTPCHKRLPGRNQVCRDTLRTGASGAYCPSCRRADRRQCVTCRRKITRPQSRFCASCARANEKARSGQRWSAHHQRARSHARTVRRLIEARAAA